MIKRVLPLALAASALIALAGCGHLNQEPAAARLSPPAPNGNPLLPPKWAFGVLYGTYHDQAGVLADMARLRNEGYCGDLIWIDSSWLHGEYNSGAEHYIDFKFDPLQFSDPAGMVRTLRENHFHFGVWEWPFIDKSNPLYAYGESHHLFVADPAGNVVKAGGWHGVKFTGQFDFTNPAAVAWWNQLHEPLVAMGLDFYKLDTGGGFRAPGVLFDGNSSQEHLRHLYHKTAFDLSAKAAGDRGRGFIVTHEAPADDNCQTPGIWTGDTPSSWAGLLLKDMGVAAKLDTPETAAYWCGDTGGYNLVKQADGTRTDASDELYIRWLEYSAFTPIEEFFSSKPAKGRFPWNFGPEAQKIFHEYTKLRYRLLPFRYSNAQAAYHEIPVVYPVWFIGGTQIVLGHGSSEILVEPVVVPGATSAVVPLPAGSSWIDYWTGAVYPGGTSPSVEAPLEREPVFVKAGSIIPMGPEMHYVDELPADSLTLDIYPSGTTSYTLYEDDGKTTDYIGGAYATTEIASDDSSGNEIVSIGAARGEFDGQLESRTYLLKINLQPAAPLTVSRDGAALERLADARALSDSASGWCYEPGVVWVKLRLPTRESAKVSLERQ